MHEPFRLGHAVPVLPTHQIGGMGEAARLARERRRADTKHVAASLRGWSSLQVPCPPELRHRSGHAAGAAARWVWSLREFRSFIAIRHNESGDV